jgi:hypothetical protein
MSQASTPVSAVTKANPGSVTAVAHGFSSGDDVGFLSVGGMTELNGNGYTVTKVNADTFTIGVNTSGFTTYVSGGVAHLNTNGSAFTTYTSAGKAREAVATISGMDHLEGESVDVLGDGNVYGAKTVTSGAVSSFSPAISIAQIGYGYTSTMKTMRPDIGAEDGTSQGKTKRVFEVVMRFVNTLGVKVGPTAAELDEVQFRSGSDPMDSSPPLFTGDKTIKYRGGWDKDGQIIAIQDQPLPLHIIAVIKRLVTNDG